MKDKGVVMHRKPEFFDSLVELGFIGKVEVKDAVAFEAVEVVMGMGYGIEAVRRSERKNRGEAFIGQGAKGPINRSEADLFALFSEGEVEFFGRGMVLAALKLLPYAIAFPSFLPVHNFHSDYKSQ